nr:chloride channel protein [Sphingomonas vulcanisoli]
MTRRHGPSAPIWRRRAATLSGAIALGLVALLFAKAADWASLTFLHLTQVRWWAPLIVTPIGFTALAWLTRRFAPDARGSGIPQVIVARQDPEAALASLVSVRTAVAKFGLTVGSLLVGASTGREGPTVQVSAAIMALAHRIFRVPIRASVMVAGGAAGVAAAFNTPLAGVTIAIEELAAAYDQRMTLLVMTAVLVSGMVSLGIAGDYTYFGVVPVGLPLRQALIVTPIAGIAGGLAGGLFSRALLDMTLSPIRPIAWMRRHAILLAFLSGVTVAVIGVATGMTWGTSYAPARHIIEGADVPHWFGSAKALATLATSISGMPGGVFAPSLAVGAGLGDLLKPLFPLAPAGAVVLLGMAGYFTGVVRAPLTSVVILSEITGSHALLLPLLATALIADTVAGLVCRERLYHGLSRAFAARQLP